MPGPSSATQPTSIAGGRAWPGGDRRSAGSRRTPTRTSRPDGLNLTALWTRFAKTWASRAASPRTGGRSGSTSTRSVTPWRSANGRRRSADSVGDPPEVDVVEVELAAAALDPGQVEQLGDHLGNVAGFDLELADPLAHLRRHRRPAASARLGVAASATRPAARRS